MIKKTYQINRFLLLLVCILALVLSACGGGSSNPDPDPDPQPDNQLAGTYDGEVTVGIGSSGGLFANASITIDNAGNVTGTTTAIEPSDDAIIGEKGTLSGTMKIVSSAENLEFNVIVESPSVGKYVMKGNGIFVDKEFAAAFLSIYDASDSYIGNDGYMNGRKR